MLSLMLVGAGSSYAADYTYTLSKGDFSDTKLTNASGGVTWTVKATWKDSNNTYWAFDNNNGRGFQIGSTKKYATAVSLSTDDIAGTITKVVVNASKNSKGKANLSVTVGGSAFGGSAKGLSGKAADYSFEGSASGEISINYTDVTTAVYLKSVSVTYTEGQKTVTATISDAGYSTYVTEQPTDFSTAVGLTAFKATFNEAQTVVTITPIATAPANTPVILKGAKGDYELAVAEAVPAALTDNELKVSDGTVTGDGSTVWVLASGDNGIGFYPMGSGVTVPKGKAYLQITSSTGAKPFLGMSGGSTTGIKVIGADGKRGDGVMYNLAGQRVGKSYKGIVIMNGKKYINR